MHDQDGVNNITPYSVNYKINNSAIGLSVHFSRDFPDPGIVHACVILISGWDGGPLPISARSLMATISQCKPDVYRQFVCQNRIFYTEPHSAQNCPVEI